MKGGPYFAKASKGAYVDGFVFTVPKKNTLKYKKMAEDGRKAWMKFGALAFYECMGDDLKAKKAMGFKPLTFLDIAKPKSGETVWFSFIVFKNKAHRNAVNKKVMAYFGKQFADEKNFKMPNDPAKMAYGGFKAIVKG